MHLLPPSALVFFSVVLFIDFAALFFFLSLSNGNSSSDTDSVSPRSAGAATGNSSSETASVSGSCAFKVIYAIKSQVNYYTKCKKNINYLYPGL